MRGGSVQLTLHTDYSLRLLMYLGQKGDQATVKEIAEHYRISQNHLVKVAHRLARLKLISSSKGRGGGIRLAVEPGRITIGEIVRKIEPHLNLVECFNMSTNTCPIAGLCRLKGALHEAQQQFFRALDGRTLAQLVTSGQ